MWNAATAEGCTQAICEFGLLGKDRTFMEPTNAYDFSWLQIGSAVGGRRRRSPAVGRDSAAKAR